MSLRSSKQANDSTDGATPQAAHLLSLARDASKQLEGRALLLVLPLLVSTIAVTGAAKPHFQRIDGTYQRLQAQTAAAEKLRSEETFEEGLKLNPEQLRQLRQREESTAEAGRISNSVLNAIKRATVDLSIPGSEKVRIPLFYASNILQLAILAALLYLWTLRRRALQLLDQAAKHCTPSQIKANRLLGTPGSPFLQPLPNHGWRGNALLDAQSQNSLTLFPVGLLLMVLCALSVWLTHISSKTSDIVIRGNALEQLPLVASCMLVAVTVGLSLGWLLLPPRYFVSAPIDFRARRLFAFAAISMAIYGSVVARTKPEMAKAIWQNIRQFFCAVTVYKPRFKRKKLKSLQSELVRDGFLFNPKSQKAHVVVGGRVISVQKSPRQEAAFASFLPIGIKLSVPKSKPFRYGGPLQVLPRTSSASVNVINIANGHTPIAIERFVLNSLSESPQQAMDFLRDSILSRFPRTTPQRASSLDLRLIDLYAKLSTRSYDAKRLEQFVTAIIRAKLGFLLSDRIDRWLDPKSKWRKRVLDYGRCSNVGYPVVGRCEFESRPIGPYMRRRQWFEPSPPLGEA